MDVLASLRSSLFWVSAPIFFINFALPVKSKELGASAFEVGGLFSLFTLSLLLFRPVVGYALDRYGRRWFLCLAVLLYIFAYVGYGFAADITSMYLARFLQGLGAALLLLSVDAITADLTESDNRATAMGQNLQAQTRSTFIGATLGFGLIAVLPTQGWQISFLLFALMAAFAFWVALMKVPETLAKDDVEQPQPISSDFYRLMVWMVPIGFASALIMPIYLVYLSDFFTSDKRLLSWAFLPAGLVFAILPAKLGQLVDRYGATKPLLFGSLSLVGLYILLPLGGGFWAVVAIYTLSSVAWAVIEPARKALTAQLAGNQVARGFGLAEMAFGAGAVAGPLIGGYVYDQYAPPIVFYLNASVVLASVLIFLVWVGKGVKHD